MPVIEVEDVRLSFGEHIEMVLPALWVIFSGIRILASKNLIDAL